MNDCAVYIRVIPGDPFNYIWIYRRAGHWLVERGHNFNTRMSQHIIQSDNDLDDYLAMTRPAPLDD